MSIEKAQFAITFASYLDAGLYEGLKDDVASCLFLQI